MKKEATAIKFDVCLNLDTLHEFVYVDHDVFQKLSDKEGDYRKAEDKIEEAYFTKEKLFELKKRFCDYIMNTEDSIFLCANDLDCYPVEEREIFKM